MKLSDLITPEVLDKSIHPGRTLNETDIKESKALLKDNQALIDVFKHCHVHCSELEGEEKLAADTWAGATVVAIDRAIRQATADANPTS